MPSRFALLNFSSIFIFNNFASSSCFRLCSLFYTSFSFAISCCFSITLFAFMLLWTPELRKRAQLPTINTNCFRQLPLFFVLELPTRRIHLFTYPSSIVMTFLVRECYGHSYDILGAKMLWKPKEARILKN
jgi:hypothetical protein